MRTVLYTLLTIVLYPLHVLYVLGDNLEDSDAAATVLLYITLIGSGVGTWWFIHPVHWYSIIGTLCLGGFIFFWVYGLFLIAVNGMAHLCLFACTWPEKLYQAAFVRVKEKDAYRFYLMHRHQKIYQIQPIKK